MFGPAGIFWTMAPLRYAANFDPFLSLDCAGGGIKFCLLATLITGTDLDDHEGPVDHLLRGVVVELGGGIAVLCDVAELELEPAGRVERHGEGEDDEGLDESKYSIQNSIHCILLG